MTPTHETFEMFVSVLGLKEKGGWSVVALEMDIWAHGKTADEALKELAGLVAMQISFARQKGQMEMIYKPADHMYFQVFHRVREERLTSASTSRKDSRYRALGMPIPLPPKGQFTMEHATA